MIVFIFSTDDDWKIRSRYQDIRLI